MAINFRESYPIVEWDLNKRMTFVFYNGSVDDSANGFKVMILQGGDVLTPSTEKVRFYCEKSDNTKVYLDAIIDGDYFVIDLTNQVYAIKGKVECNFQISSGGLWKTSPEFIINVDENNIAGSIESTSEFVALQNALDTVGNLTEQVNTAVQQANTAIANTNTTIENANTTNTNIQNAESIRVSNETTRQTQESTRQTNESTRQTNESDRVTVESSRVTAENSRVSAETTRVSQENSRQSNETTRQSQETARQTNTTSAISNANNAATNANNIATQLANETLEIYKPSVATYADLATTYPTPENGWTVTVTNESVSYRYNSTLSDWVNRGYISAVDKATDTTLGTVKGGGNITIGTDGTLNASEIGTLANLQTTSKTDLVGAINENTSKINNIGINVKSFGAVGDGLTDDTTAIQNAINQITTDGGGKLFFPKGKYVISNSLNISQNFICLEGVGQESTIYNGGTTSSIIFQNCERISIRDLGIKGNGGVAGANATNLHGIEFINTHHVKLYNVTILYNGGHGIYLHGGTWCHYYTKCYISQNKLDGINSVSLSAVSTDQNGNNMSVTDCSMLQNGANGINWKASGLNVNGCDIELNQLSGILIDTSGSTLSANGINIVGNYFEMNRQGQIKFHTITGYVITGVLIDGNSLYSTYVGGASALIVGTGVADSLYNFEIGDSNRFEIGGETITKHVDLNNMPTIYSKICARNLTQYTTLGRAEVNLPIKNVAISGLFHQKGYSFTVPNKSDNIFGMTTKTGIYELPLKEGDYLYKVRCFVETNCTDNYNVTFTLQSADVTGANVLSTVSLATTTVTGGGNKLVEWVVYGSIAYRHIKNKNLYLKVDITNPTTGSTMYLYDLIIEYI